MSKEIKYVLWGAGALVGLFALYYVLKWAFKSTTNLRVGEQAGSSDGNADNQGGQSSKGNNSSGGSSGSNPKSTSNVVVGGLSNVAPTPQNQSLAPASQRVRAGKDGANVRTKSGVTVSVAPKTQLGKLVAYRLIFDGLMPTQYIEVEHPTYFLVPEHKAEIY